MRYHILHIHPDGHRTDGACAENTIRAGVGAQNDSNGSADHDANGQDQEDPSSPNAMSRRNFEALWRGLAPPLGGGGYRLAPTSWVC